MQYYDAERIIIHNWGDLTKNSDDKKWTRDWKIKLKIPILESTDLASVSRKLSYEGFQVDLDKDSTGDLSISVQTKEWGWEDYLYFNTYKMFEEIDYLLGTIDTIQGQARDTWYPWLWRKRTSEDSFKLSRIIMRRIEIGLRIDPDKGISFFGLEDVNKLIKDGASITSLEPVGVITKELEDDSKNHDFVITGFSILVTIKEPGIETD
jgi:hypothetical protein